MCRNLHRVQYRWHSGSKTEICNKKNKILGRIPHSAAFVKSSISSKFPGLSEYIQTRMITLTMGIVAIRPLTEGNLLPICVHTIITTMLKSNLMKKSMSSPVRQAKRLPCLLVSRARYDNVYMSLSLNTAFGFIMGFCAH